MTDETTGDDAELERILSAATAHGDESEPDMEVGDLQQVLRAAWEIMSPEQRTALVANDEVATVLDWLPEQAVVPGA